MQPKKVVKIKVRSGKGMVSHLSTLGPTTPRRFIGWKYDAEQKAYVQTDQPEEIVINRNNKNHYIKMVKDGSLIAADKETADFCSVKFVK